MEEHAIVDSSLSAVLPDTSQFNVDRTYPGRWTVTFSNAPINMFVPTTITHRLHHGTRRHSDEREGNEGGRH